jgi:hypothetical protein
MYIHYLVSSSHIQTTDFETVYELTTFVGLADFPTEHIFTQCREAQDHPLRRYKELLD